MDEQNSQPTFINFKSKLIKILNKLSCLCDCEVALIIFDSNNELHEYGSPDINDILLKYARRLQARASFITNETIIKATNEIPVNTSTYNPIPSTEVNCNGIDERSHMLLFNQNSSMPMQQPTYSAPMNLPVNNYSGEQMFGYSGQSMHNNIYRGSSTSDTTSGNPVAQQQSGCMGNGYRDSAIPISKLWRPGFIDHPTFRQTTQMQPSPPVQSLGDNRHVDIPTFAVQSLAENTSYNTDQSQSPLNMSTTTLQKTTVPSCYTEFEPINYSKSQYSNCPPLMVENSTPMSFTVSRGMKMSSEAIGAFENQSGYGSIGFTDGLINTSIPHLHNQDCTNLNITGSSSWSYNGPQQPTTPNDVPQQHQQQHQQQEQQLKFLPGSRRINNLSRSLNSDNIILRSYRRRIAIKRSATSLRDMVAIVSAKQDRS